MDLRNGRLKLTFVDLVLQINVNVAISVVEPILITVPLVYIPGAKLLTLNASSRLTINRPAYVPSRPARASVSLFNGGVGSEGNHFQNNLSESLIYIIIQ